MPITDRPKKPVQTEKPVKPKTIPTNPKPVKG